MAVNEETLTSRRVTGRVQHHDGAVAEHVLVGRLRFDLAAAGRELGWAPKIRLEDGIARTAAWFATHPDRV